MTRLIVSLMFMVVAASPAWAGDICKGKKPGTVTFYDQEVSRDAPLPKPVESLDFDKPMFAVLCLTDKVGPQEEGGKKFRVVLYVKQINLPEGKYSSWVQAKQVGVYRPQLSQPRKDIILAIEESFDHDGLKHKLDEGEYEFRLQAASEKATGKVDVQFDFSNDVAYVQELRKAGYLSDGKIKVVKQ